MKYITFQFDGLPPSYNKHFKINYNLREIYLTQEVRDFKTKIKFITPPLEVCESDKLRLTIQYNHEWYFKNGSIKKKDIQNLDKILIDCLATRFGCDDKQFWEVHLFKIQNSEKTFTVVNVEII